MREVREGEDESVSRWDRRRAEEFVLMYRQMKQFLLSAGREVFALASQSATKGQGPINMSECRLKERDTSSVAVCLLRPDTAKVIALRVAKNAFTAVYITRLVAIYNICL